jgi:hypothetical protein
VSFRRLVRGGPSLVGLVDVGAPTGPKLAGPRLQNLHPRFKSGRRLQFLSQIRVPCESAHIALTVALTILQPNRPLQVCRGRSRVRRGGQVWRRASYDSQQLPRLQQERVQEAQPQWVDDGGTREAGAALQIVAHRRGRARHPTKKGLLREAESVIHSYSDSLRGRHRERIPPSHGFAGGGSSPPGFCGNRVSQSSFATHTGRLVGGGAGVALGTVAAMLSSKSGE